MLLGVVAIGSAAAFRCPGPDPQAGPIGPGGAGGAGASTASGGSAGHGATGGTGGSTSSGGSGSGLTGGTGGFGGSISSGGFGGAGLTGGTGGSISSGGFGGLPGLGGAGGSISSGGFGGLPGLGGAGGSISSGGSGGLPGLGGAGGGCAGTLCGGTCVDVATDLEHCGGCFRPCSPFQTDVLQCSGGLCDSTCTPGFANLSLPAAPQPDDGCEAVAKRVFVTSTSPLASFNGTSGADAFCQSAANQVPLGGTWRAWVSDSGSSPASRFVPSPSPYVLLDGTPVASNWLALLGGTLQNGIDLDEHALLVSNVEVWTGTTVNGDGDGSSYCVDWTSTSAAITTVVGLTGRSDFGWSEVYPQWCDRTGLRLYCFEQ
ncbi:MAG: hypothetical protein HY908_21690 [Myxococcales bacterium]|nr:hypothetical protein [Myxococcales bacterium]